MMVRSAFLALAGLALLLSPVQAQQGRPHGPATAPRANPGMARGTTPRGGQPRGPAGWNQFHHDTNPVRISPHRFGATNFPRPNAWRGDVHIFDLPRWQTGQWRHVSHNGRFGWWWVAGPSWYFFDAPLYPYPDPYTPPGRPFGWWYWCDAYQEYYPYVTFCPVPWESVMPRE